MKFGKILIKAILCEIVRSRYVYFLNVILNFSAIKSDKTYAGSIQSRIVNFT